MIGAGRDWPAGSQEAQNQSFFPVEGEVSGAGLPSKMTVETKE
jgi:hypothetical protein